MCSVWAEPYGIAFYRQCQRGVLGRCPERYMLHERVPELVKITPFSAGVAYLRLLALLATCNGAQLHPHYRRGTVSLIIINDYIDLLYDLVPRLQNKATALRTTRAPEQL